MTEAQQRTAGMAIASFVLGLLFIIPFLGLLFSLLAIIFGIVALVQISKRRAELKGSGFAITGILLGSIGLLITVVLVVLAAIAVPNLMNAKLASNEAMAKATLRTISTAAETYATANQGYYPMFSNQLTNVPVPYLNTDYCNQEMTGYYYSCQFSSESYRIVAMPTELGESGIRTFTIETGGVLTEDVPASFQNQLR